MQVKRLAGPDAASRKYDILTALGCHALGADASTQRLVLRFLTLITARYNWRQNILHVGQREIARLWDVDERTVKREMAKLRALGWLALESPARRGRVASYALDLPAIHGATRAAWTRVGPDYEGRMAGLAEPEAHSDPAPSGRPAAAPDFGPTVVPFPRAEAAADLGSADPLEPCARRTASRGSGGLRKLVRCIAQRGQRRGPSDPACPERLPRDLCPHALFRAPRPSCGLHSWPARGPRHGRWNWLNDRRAVAYHRRDRLHGRAGRTACVRTWCGRADARASRRRRRQ